MLSYICWKNIRFKSERKRKERIRVYKKWTEEYINVSHVYRFNEVYKKDWSEYDYAITGSDQVWHNWSGKNCELEYFYLMFMPPKKRISYAPSFGFFEFPKKDCALHKKGLQEIELLSCREQHGQKLIEEINGKTAPLVSDPTFLLDKSEWREIEKKPSYDVPSKFMLVYFLGNQTEEYRSYYKRKAQEFFLHYFQVLWIHPHAL